MRKIIIILTLLFLIKQSCYAMQQELLPQKNMKTVGEPIDTQDAEKIIIYFDSETEEEIKREKQKSQRKYCIKLAAITSCCATCCTIGAFIALFSIFLSRR